MTAIRILIFVLVGMIPVVVGAQAVDSDNDGLSDSDESFIYFTDPTSSDTDGDGYVDGEEVALGYSPRHGDNKKLIEVDSDNDYLNDKWELLLGTGLMNPDTDGDLYLDGTEVAASYDPHNPKPVQKEKLITVDLEEQRLAYFFDGIELDSFLISSGKAYSPTPVGEFDVQRKVPLKDYVGAGYRYEDTKWNLHFTTIRLGYYIHGAFWHNNFGEPMSAGCVNVSYDNMEHLYWFAQLGTKIEIQ